MPPGITGSLVEASAKELGKPSVVASLQLGLATPIASPFVMVLPIDCALNSAGWNEALRFARVAKETSDQSDNQGLSPSPTPSGRSRLGGPPDKIIWAVFPKRYAAHDSGIALACSAWFQNHLIAPVLGVHCWTNVFLVPAAAMGSAFQLQGFLEDLGANRRLIDQYGRPHRFVSQAIVSARRYLRRGPLTQILANIRIYTRYILGRKGSHIDALRQLHDGDSARHMKAGLQDTPSIVQRATPGRRTWLIGAFAAAALVIVGVRLIGSNKEGQTRVGDTLPENSFALRITGSSTLSPLVLEWAEAFMHRHPGSRIDVESGGSARGISDVLAKRASLGMVSRSRRPEDGALVFHEIARDGVAVIVQSQNPLTTLSRHTLQQIYSGAINDWNQVPGSKLQGPIGLIHKADGRSTLEVFLEFTGLDASQIVPALVVGDNQHAIRSLESWPLGIAYVSAGEALASAARGSNIRVVALDEVAPDQESIASGHYSFVRGLSLVHAPDPDPATVAFLAFIQTTAPQASLRGVGFVPTRL
jgi:phosphate transport system substrate-binding protein